MLTVNLKKKNSGTVFHVYVKKNTPEDGTPTHPPTHTHTHTHAHTKIDASEQETFPLYTHTHTQQK